MTYNHTIAMGPNLGASTPFQGFKVDNTSGIGDGLAGVFTVTYTMTALQAQQMDASAGGVDQIAAFTLADFQSVLACGLPKVANPSFSVAAGTYSTCQSVTLSCSTSGAQIYYTTNGNVPDASSTPYNGAISVTSTTTIKAVAIKSGMNNSDIITNVYTLNLPQVATPTFSPVAGTYSAAQNVTISTTTSGAKIYYTTNGTTPTTGSTLYVTGTPVVVSSSLTLKAIAVNDCSINSAIASAAYVINIPQKVVNPVFSISAGTYTTCQSVTLSTTTTGAQIYYTTNGNVPDANSTLYVGAIPVSATTTIKAIAIKTGMNNSDIVTAVYTLNLPQVAKPTFSPVAGTYSTTQNVTISTATSGAKIYYTTDGTDPTSGSTLYVAGSPVVVSANKTLKAIAISDCSTNSDVASADYVIDITAPIHNQFPSTGFASIAFEDLWPSNGDYDLNDIVVDCKFDQVSNSQNKITQINAQFVLRAMGASYHDGFGMQLPVTPDKVASCVVTLDNGQPVPMVGLVSINSKGLEQGQDKAVVILFDDGYKMLPQIYPGIGVNTTPGVPWTEPQNINMTLTFSEPIDQNLLVAPYNPFIFANKDRGYEIHLPNYPPTTLANFSLFKTNDDDSNVSSFNSSSIRSYLNAQNLPWAILFYKKYDYPIEKTSILSAFLHFAEWAQSGGQVYTDWYFNTASGYRVPSNIYVKP
ncbi:MAG: chitobiase/beta-hexosaminidase C-terminal domain-containing protein [Bacteroidetes bacterium]|nr:chitobiase/beta-hexosaminidase C-terminal domain-containing protein [Bacteroidota bacterium]